MIKDRIALGTFAGIVAAIPTLISNFLLVQLGISKWYTVQLAAGMYLQPGLTDSAQGIILGILVWMVMASLLGVLISYTIYFTSTDFWWLKGIGVTLVAMYIVIYGFLFNLGAAEIIPLDFATNASVFFENILFGFLTAYLIVKWGQTPSA